MYSFILSMYKQGKIDEAKVRSYCPKFITEQQVDEILGSVKE